MLLVPAALAMLLCLATTADAPHPPTIRRSIDVFLADLEGAIDRNDRKAIAATVNYPLKVLAGGWIIPVADRATFIKYFDAFFTDDVKDLIAEAAASPGRTKSSGLIVLGANAVRILRFGETFRIIGISVPMAGGRVHAARRAATRVEVTGGPNPAKFAGTLARGEHESYVVSARRNELLEVRIEGVKAREIVARVVDAGTGTPVDQRAADGVRVWAGRVPASGDYRIEIVRTVVLGDPLITYTLSIGLR